MTKKCSKLIVLLFAICTLCFTALGVAACNKKNQGHEHTYGEWQITKPTETEIGSAVKTCSTCDKNEKGHTVTVTLPVLGNEGYTKSADTATCEADGEIVYTIILENETISFPIKSSAKGHSFNEDFWLGDGYTHWHSSSCGHNIKGDEEPCTDENGDSNCDICGYLIHKHSYEWNGDDTEHWLEPTCGDTTEIKDKEPHIDADNDDVCDTCGKLLPHTHKYSEDWTFDENTHWHAPICTDTTVGAGDTVHKFKNGLCECGVVEAEINAYKILKEKADLQDSYASWLNSIKEDGVTNVTVTEAGDVIYNYGDGTTETIYVAERTVKVKATTSSSEGVAHVWIMISLYRDGEYQEINGMYALGIAETDDNGVAEITFSPISGYTSKNVEYRVRVAEAKDIAAYFGISEENAKPIPNRYLSRESSDSYIIFEVSENETSDGIVGQFLFHFSKGWNAYNQFTLPYARYFEDPMNAESKINEVDTKFEFTSSGDYLFDYFYFIPSNKYSFASADSTFTPDQLAVIEKNFALAASGIYKIYFTVEGNANVTLYYWNEGGVNLGAYHVTNSDGTPSDEYITSISGGTAGEGKFTGGSYVDVIVTPANGLRNYQFGIISDKAVKISFTVERTGDYEEKRNDSVLGVGEQNSITAAIAGNGTVTPIMLDNIPAGLYALTATPGETFSLLGAEILSAYTNGTNNTSLWEYGTSAINGLFKGIINIPANTEVIYIRNNSTEDFEGILTLEQYTIPELVSDAPTNVPAANAKANNNASDYTFNIPLASSVLSGNYYIEVTLCGPSVSGRTYMVTVCVGDREYTISTTSYVTTSITYSTFIEITADDHYITINNNTAIYNSYMARVRLVYAPETQQDTQTFVDHTSTSALNRDKYFTFKAPQVGTYKITLISVEDGTVKNLTVTNAKSGATIIKKVTSDTVDTLSGTFELQEGEEIILKITKNTASYVVSYNFIIEYENN